MDMIRVRRTSTPFPFSGQRFGFDPVVYVPREEVFPNRHSNESGGVNGNGSANASSQNTTPDSLDPKKNSWSTIKFKYDGSNGFPQNAVSRAAPGPLPPPAGGEDSDDEYEEEFSRYTRYQLPRNAPRYPRRSYKCFYYEDAYDEDKDEDVFEMENYGDPTAGVEVCNNDDVAGVVRDCAEFEDDHLQDDQKESQTIAQNQKECPGHTYYAKAADIGGNKPKEFDSAIGLNLFFRR